MPACVRQAAATGCRRQLCTWPTQALCKQSCVHSPHARRGACDTPPRAAQPPHLASHAWPAHRSLIPRLPAPQDVVPPANSVTYMVPTDTALNTLFASLDPPTIQARRLPPSLPSLSAPLRSSSLPCFPLSRARFPPLPDTPAWLAAPAPHPPAAARRTPLPLWSPAPSPPCRRPQALLLSAKALTALAAYHTVGQSIT